MMPIRMNHLPRFENPQHARVSPQDSGQIPNLVGRHTEGFGCQGGRNESNVQHLRRQTGQIPADLENRRRSRSS